MTPRETYLDWNATAPLRSEAAGAMNAALARCGNPSSVHRWGRAARQEVERAREAVAALIGAAPDGVVFTSGGTEANHLGMRSSRYGWFLTSAVEHASILEARRGAQRVPVDCNGLLDLGVLSEMLKLDTGSYSPVISVMAANNETGVIQPVREVAEIVHARGGLLHCDAVQAAGKIPFSMSEIGADLLSLSAHKLGGPPGVGALVMARDLYLGPLLVGGGQEQGRRAGTENLPGIAGFAAAAEAAAAGIADYDRVRGLRDELEAAALAAAPEAMVIGAEVPRLPNTTALTQIIALDLDGVMVSAGAACSSGKVGPSHVLAAMGLPPEIANATIRISLGWTTTEADIAHFLDAWTALARRLLRRAA
jgi:cysteine desulfurase